MKRLLERLLSFHEVFDIKNEISQIIQNEHFDKTLRSNVYILQIRDIIDT